MKKKAVLLLLHISITFSMETEGHELLMYSSGAMNHISRQNGDTEPSDSSHNSEGESAASALLCDRLNIIDGRLARLKKVLGEGLELNGEPYSFSQALTDLYTTIGSGLKDGNGIIPLSDVSIALLEDRQNIESELASTKKRNENIIRILKGLYYRIKFLEDQNRQLNSGLAATVTVLQQFKTELETVKQQRITVDVARVTNQQKRFGTVPLDNPDDDFTPRGCSPSSVEPVESKEPEHPVAQKSVAQKSAEDLGGLIEKMYSKHTESNGTHKAGPKTKSKKRKQRKIRRATPRPGSNKGIV